MKGKIIAFLIPVVYVFALLLVVSPSGVSASDNHKIKICHATSSSSNPYTSNDVDKNATAGGHDLHNGSVWTFGASSWGDIIPPYSFTEREVVNTIYECPDHYKPSSYTCPGRCRKVSGNGPTCRDKVAVEVYGDVTHQYLGKNWTTEGQAVYNKNCNVPVKCVASTPIVYGEWSEWQINPDNEAQMFRVKFGSQQDLFGRGSCEVAPVFEYTDRALCEWDTATYADERTCVEPEYCALDDSLLADDPNCVACEWNSEILAGDESCVAPEYCFLDENLLADDPKCVVCEWNNSLLAGDSLCVKPVDDEGEVQGVTDEKEVKGTTDVVLADTGASDSTLVYLVEGILVLGTLVSSAMLTKKYAI